MKCNNCKKTIPDNSKFCPFCRNLIIKECVSCGAELIKDARYCNQCGEEIGSIKEKKKIDKREEGTVCKACGAALSKDAGFCRKCGEKIR